MPRPRSDISTALFEKVLVDPDMEGQPGFVAPFSKLQQPELMYWLARGLKQTFNADLLKGKWSKVRRRRWELTIHVVQRCPCHSNTINCRQRRQSSSCPCYVQHAALPSPPSPSLPSSQPLQGFVVDSLKSRYVDEATVAKLLMEALGMKVVMPPPPTAADAGKDDKKKKPAKPAKVWQRAACLHVPLL